MQCIQFLGRACEGAGGQEERSESSTDGHLQKEVCTDSDVHVCQCDCYRVKDNGSTRWIKEINVLTSQGQLCVMVGTNLAKFQQLKNGMLKFNLDAAVNDIMVSDKLVTILLGMLHLCAGIFWRTGVVASRHHCIQW